MTQPTPEVDLDFRPESYWDPADPVTAIVGNVTGELRRRMIRDIVTGEAAARVEDPEVRQALIEVEDGLLDDVLVGGGRPALEQTHPWFMGGEYLAGYLPGEVEIARLVLESTTMDVFSVRARRRTRCMKYRVVDEYESRLTHAHRTSRRPLTLGQLVELIDSIEDEGEDWTGGDFTSLLRDYNAQHCDDPEELRKLEHFVTVGSEFYPDLEPLYRRRAARWLEQVLLERGGQS